VDGRCCASTSTPAIPSSLSLRSRCRSERRTEGVAQHLCPRIFKRQGLYPCSLDLIHPKIEMKQCGWEVLCKCLRPLSPKRIVLQVEVQERGQQVPRKLLRSSSPKLIPLEIEVQQRGREELCKRLQRLRVLSTKQIHPKIEVQERGQEALRKRLCPLHAEHIKPKIEVPERGRHGRCGANTSAGPRIPKLIPPKIEVQQRGRQVPRTRTGSSCGGSLVSSSRCEGARVEQRGRPLILVAILHRGRDAVQWGDQH